MFPRMNNPTPYLLTIILILFTSGCHSGKKGEHHEFFEPYTNHVELRHAKGFQIDRADDHTRLTILNPWSKDDEPYAVYYLYPTLPEKLPSDGISIQIPVSSLVVNSFSYFEFLSLLGETDAIKGVTDGFRIYNPLILEKIEQGVISDMGDPFQPNLEKVMTVKPDAVINSAYAQVDSYSERLTRAGIPVIYSLEWMENEPLARAEWIRMIAAFFGKDLQADSLFAEIEQRYNFAREQIPTNPVPPSLLAGDNFQGTWYVPGGKSFNAALFRDAGLQYRYSDNRESGSIGLDIESVLTQFSAADFWFGCESDSYAELAEKDAKYLLLNAVKKRQVFNNHNRITLNGGNDYFESGAAHPDLVLSDLIRAVYPEALPEYSFTYIKPLEEEPFRE
ncbi:ABC transporter substrate-binding protein [Dysgonomonadaceae bacterium zrk40]|nr:ABC transporter substrate-binding protein [Dysgonomonadaceae bacterium zrk40]